MAQDEYRLTSDPAFYVMAALFAILTTALPGALGQPRLMPIAQAIVLTVFIAVPVRSGRWKQGVWIMGLWIILEMVTIAGLTMLFAEHMERAFGNGFEFRTDVLAWIYGASALPDTVRMQPAYRFMESIGVTLGSLATAGLVGNWFLVRSANMTGFTIGIVWRTVGGPLGALLSVPVWSLLRTVGMAGMVLAFSEPILTGNWSPLYYWTNRRSLLIVSIALIALGILFELTAPAIWQTLLPVRSL